MSSRYKISSDPARELIERAIDVMIEVASTNGNAAEALRAFEINNGGIDHEDLAVQISNQIMFRDQLPKELAIIASEIRDAVKMITRYGVNPETGKRLDACPSRVNVLRRTYAVIDRIGMPCGA